MLLEKLTIYSKQGIIRDIPFNLQGLNLIIDTTPSSDSSTASGNNVGKTTFIRCIDFCFGSSGRDIYQDKETKNDNEEVKQFLIDNEVSFTLILLKKDSSKIFLKRSFNKELDLIINDQQHSTISAYCNKLNELLFHIPANERKVSFRSIIKKFVRSDENSDSRLYKILHQSVKDIVYEALYLKLFGFPEENILTERLQVSDRLQTLESELRKIKGKSSLPKLQSRLVQLQNLIDEKETQVKNINLPKTYDNLINDLRSLKSKTGELSSLVATLNTKITLSIKTRDDLKHSETQIDPIAVSQLYKEAENLLPTVDRTFKQVLEFHNKMIANKIKFVELHIKALEQERNEKKQELSSLLVNQSRILQLLQNTGTFDDLIKIREEINTLYVEKGKIISQIEAIETVQNEIEDLTHALNEINSRFEPYIQDLNSNIQNVFNKYFKQYTLLTHGDQIYVYYDPETRKFEFDNIEGNVGDGYKKTEIITFDLAFISYFNELGLGFPLFVVHDKLEIVHKNQIEITFEIAESVNGQFVVSVLQEKIAFMGEEFINENKILELSQEDKLFRF